MAKKEKQAGLKPEGWHSKKHQSDRAHAEARARYQRDHGPAARRRKAAERAAKKK